MSSHDTVSTGDVDPAPAPANRTIAALSLALASGTALGEVEIDLTDAEQCRIGAYTLVERIGGGGMGVVYRAHQQSLERDVAIKLLNLRLGDDENALARFRFEARSAAALNHPNIVQVLEIGQQQGIAYIAMQLVRGQSLAERIVSERFAPKPAVELMLRLCDAVGYAHRLHLLHLDLKPANILIDERGEPLVADFGLARRMDDHGQVQAQEVSGTPAYMAPEQVLIKQYRLSAATDIYALGAILYEMLCGVPPHGRGNPAEVMQRALAGQIPPPHQFAPKLPRDLEAITMKCLSLRAADRYASVETLAEDLRRYASNLPVSVRRPTLRERVLRWYAREPRFTIAISALCVFAVACSITFGWMWREVDRQHAAADGIIRLMMLQTPEWVPPYQEDGDFRYPMHCSQRMDDCSGNAYWFDAHSAAPKGSRYLEALREYVPTLKAWGNTHLSNQVAGYLHDIELKMDRPRLERTIATSGETDGLIFAYMLAAADLDRVDENASTMAAWLAQATPIITKPWQAQLLAESCRNYDGDPDCAKAILRFRQLDPDNALAWIQGMPWVLGKPADDQLLRAARAPRWDRADAALLDAALAFGKTHRSLTRMEPHAFALEVADSRWQFLGDIGSYCRRSRHFRNQPAIEQACIALFLKVHPLMNPSQLDEQTAQEMLLHFAEDPSIRAEAEKRWRNVRWARSARNQLLASRDFDAAHHFQILRARGEYAYEQELLLAAHLPIDAPPEFATIQPLRWPKYQPPSVTTP
ncbi:MAG: serine/threonine protein kinase [Proteobacteria bacterium]|nr:serine/threonine protein kinase [Pseudomonadota bacterium]